MATRKKPEAVLTPAEIATVLSDGPIAPELMPHRNAQRALACHNLREARQAVECPTCSASGADPKRNVITQKVAGGTMFYCEACASALLSVSADGTVTPVRYVPRKSVKFEVED